MSDIKVFPVTCYEPETIKLVIPFWQKLTNQQTKSWLPICFAAVRGDVKEYDENNVGLMGFRYRRQSHHAEITWYGGYDRELLAEASKAMVLQAILEGRKRVECYNEDPNPHARFPMRPGEKLNEAFRDAGYQHEGGHKDYTKYLEDVQMYGHVWLEDGIPQMGPNTHLTLINNGEYEVEVDEKGKKKIVGPPSVKFYKAKNILLYEKDRDLYRQNKDDGKTFAQHIEEANEKVCSMENVTVLEEWHKPKPPKQRKAKQEELPVEA
ncbi:hypothetical protein [Streptomyces sp. CoH17]|uniref:hypothetical protein n=1 Tax=Streptomyces sp. CoH17 TaxID=2992806 RepID=UPI00226F1E50|nr:hypothetical protein [Streptomyces sp. CoH17]